MTNEPAFAYHVPVLLHESVEGLNINPDGIYVDATFGGGGHSAEILSRLSGKGHLFSFDQDNDAVGNIKKTGVKVTGPSGAEQEKSLSECGNFTFIQSNFRYLSNWMRYYHVDHIDGLLADLGVSSHHFDDEHRGFSFRFDAPLDMRMNKKASRTAADIVNNYSEQALADVLYFHGELKNARRIASKLVAGREKKQIETTQDFLDIVNPLMPPTRQKKDLAKLFQALRIEVNHEMTALNDMLTQATNWLAGGGRLVVITYQSLEDRIVKNFMKAGNREGSQEKDFYGNILSPYKLINNRVIVPDEEEQKRNPRSRSAKLRIAERK